MERLQRVLVVLVLGMFLAGCATAMATLPQGPDVYSLPLRAGAPTLVVAPPVDERSNKERLGTISALGVRMKDDPTQLVSKEVVVALHGQGINGLLARVSGSSPESFAQIASEHKAQGVLALSVQSISIESFDALMDPPTAKVTLGAVLYDNRGNLVERGSVTGQVQRRINTFAADRATGELVSESIRDAAQRLVGRGAVAEAIKKVTRS